MNVLKQLFGSPAPFVDVNEVHNRLNNGKRPHLIDVRQPSEFAAGHIKGAKLVPLHDLQRHIDKLPRDRTIICVCQSGARSGSATRQLVGLGFDSYNMRGGMIAWQRAGLPIKKGKK